MNITEVRIRIIENDTNLRAVASITFDDEFVVHDLKLIDGKKGLFIAMPSKKMCEGDYRDTAHPLHQRMRNRIFDAVFEAYEKRLEKLAVERAAEAEQSEANGEFEEAEQCEHLI